MRGLKSGLTELTTLAISVANPIGSSDMASVYQKSRDKKSKGKRYSPWYISYTNELGQRKVVKGFTDKALTEQLAAKLERDVHCAVKDSSTLKT